MNTAKARKGALGYGVAAVFGTQGRIGRIQFGVSVVYQTFLSAIVAVPMVIVGPMMAAGGDFGDITGVVAFALIGLVAELAITSLLFFSVRARLNDIGISNWWTIPMSVPTLAWLAGSLMYAGLAADVIQTVAALGSVGMVGFLLGWPGTKGPNAYGDPPRTPDLRTLQSGQRPPALN
jgi:uncharacterized membrane protein YhaH (DUF805 family)